tara:strand:- start:807 stop:1193 length:387 start_codon:yes stop_codon:yes gene_type:complete
MANNYTNYKVNLSTTALTSIYTVPTAASAIIKSIRVSNKDVTNNCTVSLSLVDTDGVSYTLETDRIVKAKQSQELLSTGVVNAGFGSTDSSFAPATPIVVKESEIVKAQAQNGGDLSIIISVLEITNA